MNDLISRSVAIDLLYKYADQKFVTDGVSIANGILKAKCFIDSKENIPTAFDLDKVIGELEREKDSFHGGIYEGTAEEFYFQKGIDKAIDIIKKHLSSTAEPPKTD